jgi:hypothetical protein
MLAPSRLWFFYPVCRIFVQRNLLRLEKATLRAYQVDPQSADKI